MDSPLYSVKHLSLKEIQKVIDSLGDFTKSTLNSHSLVMVINNSCETTFTSCGWKLLSEADFSYPLTKVISNAALNYTKLCGNDCKYYLFILREIFNVMHNKINGKDEALIRLNLINEICILKQALPCIFQAVQDMSCVHMTKSDSGSFFNDLHSAALTFMLSRFSVSVSKVLSSLICDFIEKISSESSSLKLSLEHVICHFDIFCCKILTSVAESKVLKGLFFYRKSIPSDLNIENCKFIVVWDLSMKLEIKDVSWRITDVSFMSQLNPLCVFQKVLEFLKSQNIALILTSSACDNNLKLLCERNGILLFDRLDNEEVKCMLTCFHLYALEDLNESLESHHIGELNFAKSYSCNKSHFLHLSCINSVRLFNVHHILLSAPCNAIWKEYYSECLNCFKMIHEWVKSDTNLCLQKNVLNKEIVNRSMQKLSVHKKTKDCCICSKLKLNYADCFNSKKMLSHNVMKLQGGSGTLLAPGLCELLLKIILERVPQKLSLSCSTVLHALHLAIVKSLCKRIGILFTDVKDIESTYTEFIIKCKLDDISFLEPVVCKEIMIYNILDLALHLLKIESIVFIN